MPERPDDSPREAERRIGRHLEAGAARSLAARPPAASLPPFLVHLVLVALLAGVAGCGERVRDYSGFQRFEYRQGSGEGFCPDAGLARATLERTDSGVVLSGSAFAPAGNGADCAKSEFGWPSTPCMVEIPLAPRLLTPEEEERTRTVFSRVPLKEQHPDCGLLDPCRVRHFSWDGMEHGDTCGEAPIDAGRVAELLDELLAKSRAGPSGDSPGNSLTAPLRPLPPLTLPRSMTDCVFCRIVRGDAPAHRVWEDEHHLAFLSLRPSTEGFTVVIPKAHHPSYAFELPDEVLSALVVAAKRVGRLLDERLDDVGRTGMIFEGFGVDHVHAKLFPMHGTAGMSEWRPIESEERAFFPRYEGYISSHDGERADDADLARLAGRIRGEGPEASRNG